MPCLHSSVSSPCSVMTAVGPAAVTYTATCVCRETHRGLGCLHLHSHPAPVLLLEHSSSPICISHHSCSTEPHYLHTIYIIEVTDLVGYGEGSCFVNSLRASCYAWFCFSVVLIWIAMSVNIRNHKPERKGLMVWLEQIKQTAHC